MLKKERRIFGVPAALAKNNLFAMELTRDQVLNHSILRQKSLGKCGFVDVNNPKTLPSVIAATSRLNHETALISPNALKKKKLDCFALLAKTSG